jgi:hypothetical protein
MLQQILKRSLGVCLNDTEATMHASVGRATIGQWYQRRDKGETFRVTGYDDRSRTIEIQTFDGDLDEIDAETWSTLPLGLAAPPEDWTGPVDDVQVDDLGYSEMTGADWCAPLQPFSARREDWEDTTAEEQIDSHTGRVFSQVLVRATKPH